MSKPNKKGLRVTLKSGQQLTLKREKVTLHNASNKKIKLIVTSDDSSEGAK